MPRDVKFLPQPSLLNNCRKGWTVTKSGKFPCSRRLRARREFLQARECGKKIHTRHFIIFVLKKAEGPTRLGITASRKVGGAVQRNRVKRLVRETFRFNSRFWPCDCDLSIIAKKGAPLLDLSQVVEELAVLNAAEVR
ncbi:ribonuclease P protein component [Desulfuromonas soudanensis]|uniref:ribonuclease P protein component n=1 Tax=Desulfuromonas soudanensis TaxID=1603606 RepID=UPI001E3159B6